MTTLPFDDNQDFVDNYENQPTQDNDAPPSPTDQPEAQVNAAATPPLDEQPPTEPKRKRRSRAEIAALRAAEAAATPAESAPPTTTNVAVNLNPLTGEGAVSATDSIPVVGRIDNSKDAWEKLADAEIKAKADCAATRKARRRFALAYGLLTQQAKVVASSWPSNPRMFFESFAKLCDQVEAEAQAKGVKVDAVFDLLMTLMPKVTVHSLYQIAYTKDIAAE
jgi:hypothetical protein